MLNLINLYKTSQMYCLTSKKHQCDKCILVLFHYPINLKTRRFYLVLLAAEVVQGFANQSTPNPLGVAVLHLQGTGTMW